MIERFLGPASGYLLITTTGACMFVVFGHLNDMSRSHHLIIWGTILDYYFLADVLALLNIMYRGKFCPIAPPNARARQLGSRISEKYSCCARPRPNRRDAIKV